MYSERFQKFIQTWQEDFAAERSIDEKVCLDKNGNPIPWYTYPAIEYLAQFDYSQKKIFEFGCGYSSAFWAQRAQSVTSIEDNPDWLQKWQKEFNYPNLKIRHRSENAEYENAVFEDDIKYDVIVIDGKRREQCATAAINALADGGVIIFDDSDRVNNCEEYRRAISLLRQAGLLQIDFYGFCPMNCYTKTTSLFLRRNFDFNSKQKFQPANGWGNLWSMGRRKRKDFFKKLEK